MGRNVKTLVNPWVAATFEKANLTFLPDSNQLRSGLKFSVQNHTVGESRGWKLSSKISSDWHQCVPSRRLRCRTTTVPTLVEQNQLFAEMVQVGLVVC